MPQHQNRVNFDPYTKKFDSHTKTKSTPIVKLNASQFRPPTQQPPLFIPTLKSGLSSIPHTEIKSSSATPTKTKASFDAQTKS